MADRRVAVVDDDEGIRYSLSYLFEDLHYIVEGIENGDAAMRLISVDVRPRVMLLDHMMPHMDGPTLLTTLSHNMIWRSRLAIVFITARSDPPRDDLARLLASTTVATIQKPFDLDEVVDIVERAWSTLVITTI